MHVETTDTDVLVLGGGLAGHRAAVAARETGARVAMAYKGHGASPFVIGINVPLGSGDSPTAFFEDTVRAGRLINDRRLVDVLTTQATATLEELVELRVPFAREGSRYLQRHLSGNTFPRSVYVPDGAGSAILRRLRSRCAELGVDVLSGRIVLSLLRDEGDVVGCLLTDPRSGGLLLMKARAVVLALGGLGRLYNDSTYPVDVASDAYSLALDAGARLIDMEFVQFEPTVTVHPEACRGMEMPTAMLGDGARLLNVQGEQFMFRYNPEYGERRIEKASLALCIQKEIDEGRGLPDGSVLFDATSLTKEQLASYVSHGKRLRKAGLDPARDMPHVRPAAHSQMGGVAIDAEGWSGVPGLYVGGEASGGIHGASRLAGSGATDILVFGAVAGRGAANGMVRLEGRNWQRIQEAAVDSMRSVVGTAGGAEPDEIGMAVGRTISHAAGLIRNHDDLAAGIEKLDRLQHEAHSNVRADDMNAASRVLRLRHMVQMARVVTMAASYRTESRGAHQRSDHPDQDDAHWLKHVMVEKGSGGELVLGTMPIT